MSRIRAIAIGLGVAIAACASAPARPSVRIHPLPDTLVARKVYGLTNCDDDGQPTVYVRADLDSFERRFTLVHEFTHVGQSRRFSSCRAFLEKYMTDVDFAWEMEAEAYCAAYEARRAAGRATIGHWLGMLETMRRKFDPSLPLVDVPQYMPCTPL